MKMGAGLVWEGRWVSSGEDGEGRVSHSNGI